MPAAGFSEAENEIIRAAVRELLERYGTQRALAEAMGIRQPSLSQYVKGRFNAGPHIARKAAELKGMTLDELLGYNQRVEALERYPNRGEAVRVARKDGMPEAAIAVIQSMALHSESDIPIMDWLDAIRDEARRQRRFSTDPQYQRRETADAERASTPTAEEEEGAVTRMHRLEAEEAARAKVAEAAPQVDPERPRVVRRAKKS